MGPLSFSQLKVGGGKPTASQERDTKLFTTTVTVSGFRPIMVGGTERKRITHIQFSKQYFLLFQSEENQAKSKKKSVLNSSSSSSFHKLLK